MRERRAWLTSVRRAILRVAFLADLVLAIGVPLRRRAAKGGGAEKMRRRARSPPDGEAYSWTGTSRQRRWRRLACNVGRLRRRAWRAPDRSRRSPLPCRRAKTPQAAASRARARHRHECGRAAP